MPDIQTILTIAAGVFVAVFCVMPLILFAITAFLVTRALRHLTAADTSALEAQFETLRAAHPDESTRELVQRIIHRQALRCGVIGALTGFGGFLTLLITLPIDLLASMRLQTTLVDFIAATYGHTSAGEAEIATRRFLIMSGGVRIAESSQNVLLGFAVRFVGRSFAKFIPLIGALAGFAVNYAIARASGTLALRWYSEGLPAPQQHALPPGV